MTTETESVADVVAWMLSDASAGEDFFPSEIRTFAQRIAAAHAREVAKKETWATGDTIPPPNTDVIGVWASRDEFPPEVELCGVPTAGNPERSWFNAYGICTPPDRWIHVPRGTWNSRADAAMGEPVREVIT